MQSKTINPGVLIGMLIFFNLMTAVVVRPFNLGGVLVMNVAAITMCLVGMRLLQTIRNPGPPRQR